MKYSITAYDKAETYQIEMNLEQLERLLKNLPEGIMLEICFGKEEHGEDT